MAYQKEPKNDLEKAVLFYTRLNMGHGFRTQGEKVGWKLDVQGREKAYAAADWCKIPEKIMEAAERLRGVQIENRPAVEVIRKFNFENVLIYCDPPYVLSTRCRKQYRHEMTYGRQLVQFHTLGFGVFVPPEEKIYIADDLPGGEESMIETVAHEWKHWLQYCNDEAYDEEEAEDFARQIVEECL